jgi:hypothetical protein
MNEKDQQLFERIAIALERIADSLATSQVAATRIPVGQDELPPNAEPKPDGQEAAASQSTETPKVLEPFLAQRNINIKMIPPEDGADQVIDSLSLFLGERYSSLSHLLGKIKRSMQTGAPITENLANASQDDVSTACQFCSRLHRIAFLEQYRYFRSPTYFIKAKTTTLPKAQRFFGGQWLERFILQMVKAVHAQIEAEAGEHIHFEFLINPQIILPNGDDFELDVLAAMGKSIYWIEAKSGDYQQHANKYSKFARLLGLDCSHSVMVLTDVAVSSCDAMSSLFSMTVCNLHSFEERLLAIARKDNVPNNTPEGICQPADGVPKPPA